MKLVEGNERVADLAGQTARPLPEAAVEHESGADTGPRKHAEEIIDTEDIRHNPGLTSIPYYAVDAVVHAPFGGYPGEVPGCYASDTRHVIEVFGSVMADRLGAYLDKWVHEVASDHEMLEKHVGLAGLKELQRRASVREGFRP